MRLTPCDPSVIIGVWNQHFAMPNFHSPPFHSVGRWTTQGQLCQERGLLSVANPCTTSVWRSTRASCRTNGRSSSSLPECTILRQTVTFLRVRAPIIGCVGVDVSYAAPQAQEIINVALHRQYFIDIVFV
jgi:hypothetical protein